MHLLHRRYRPLMAKGGWMASRNYKQLVRKQRDNKRFTRSLPSQLERHWNEQSPEEFIVWLRRLLVATDADDRILNEQEKEIIRQFAAAKGITL